MEMVDLTKSHIYLPLANKRILHFYDVKVLQNEYFKIIFLVLHIKKTFMYLKFVNNRLRLCQIIKYQYHFWLNFDYID